MVAPVYPPLRPEVVEECLLVDDVARELIPLPAHQLLVTLRDGEPALRLAVAVTILIIEEARRWRGDLGFLERLHIRGIEVAPREPESPRGCVVRARHQLRCVVRAQCEAEATGVELGIERAVGPHPNAAEAGRPASASQRRRSDGSNTERTSL
jgi:hypothetical protein